MQISKTESGILVAYNVRPGLVSARILKTALKVVSAIACENRFQPGGDPSLGHRCESGASFCIADTFIIHVLRYTLSTEHRGVNEEIATNLSRHHISACSIPMTAIWSRARLNVRLYDRC